MFREKKDKRNMEMNLTHFLKNKVVKNASWLIGGKLIQMFINLVVGILVARYLGPSNNGLVSYGAAYTTFFATIAALGINSVLVKEFIDHPEEEGKIIGTSLFLRVISSFLCAIAIVCFVNVVDRGEPTTIWVVSLCSLGLIFHIFEVINYWFQSKLQSKVTAIVTLIAYVITAGYRVILMLLHADVVGFAFATSIDYIAIGVMLLFAYKKHHGRTFSISLAYGRELLKKSVHFILPGVMVSIYGQTDKVMLKQMVGEAETGFYSTAVSLNAAWCFVLIAIIDSMYPSIMKAFHVDEEKFKKRNRQLYAIVFYLALIASILYTVFAELLVGVLYGEAYMPTVAPLRIITWYTAFSYLGGARNAWVVCKNRQKYLVYIYASAALANVVLNFLFIPEFGASGAAFASLITQILTILVVPFFVKGLRENAKLMIEAILLKGVRGR